MFSRLVLVPVPILLLCGNRTVDSLWTSFHDSLRSAFTRNPSAHSAPSAQNSLFSTFFASGCRDAACSLQRDNRRSSCGVMMWTSSRSDHSLLRCGRLRLLQNFTAWFSLTASATPLPVSSSTPALGADFCFFRRSPPTLTTE